MRKLYIELYLKYLKQVIIKKKHLHKYLVEYNMKPISMSLRLIYAVLISLTLVAITRAQQSHRQPEVQLSSSCRDPNLDEGYCVDLRACVPLVRKLFEKKNDEVFVRYLQKSNNICQGVGTAVCCPGRRHSNVLGSKVWARAPSFPTANAGASTLNINMRPSLLPTERDGCGYTNRIFLKATEREVYKVGGWPWAALLGYADKTFKCGGTLITKRHVITAAHCVTKDLRFVRLGEHDLSTDTEAKHIDIAVNRTEVHPSYDGISRHNDVAVLCLGHDVQFSALIAPICMLTSEFAQKSYISYNPFAIGWGKTLNGGISSNKLLELQILILENDFCIDFYRKAQLFDNRTLSENQLDKSVICADTLVRSCRGDEGSPLMIPEPYNDTVRFYLLGVASFGVGCDDKKLPALYTNVQYFRDWIIQKIGV